MKNLRSLILDKTLDEMWYSVCYSVTDDIMEEVSMRDISDPVRHQVEVHIYDDLRAHLQLEVL